MYFNENHQAKLLEDPSLFDKAFVVAEFGRICELIDIGMIDLVHFYITLLFSIYLSFFFFVYSISLNVL